MNPHIETIEQEGYEYYTKANPAPLALVIWAANRQRELDKQEIAELRQTLDAYRSEDAKLKTMFEMQGEIEKLRAEVERLKGGWISFDVLPIRNDGSSHSKDVNLLTDWGELGLVTSTGAYNFQQCEWDDYLYKGSTLPFKVIAWQPLPSAVLVPKQPDPAFAEVLAKFKPPFMAKSDENFEDLYTVVDSNDSAVVIAGAIDEGAEYDFCNAIAEFLNNQVKKESI